MCERLVQLDDFRLVRGQTFVDRHVEPGAHRQTKCVEVTKQHKQESALHSIQPGEEEEVLDKEPLHDLLNLAEARGKGFGSVGERLDEPSVIRLPEYAQNEGIA